MNNVFKNSFSEEIWAATYKDHNDTCLDDTFRRVAKDIASAEETEEKKAEWEEKFYDLLSDFKSVSGGRIMANAGTEWTNTTYANCYVGPLPERDLDSIEGIYAVLKDQANTLKSEGGWGMNFSWIRPRGAFIAGVGVESPGSVRMMELFDKSSEIVTSGSGRASTNKKAKGKIRKGAMMGVMDCLSGDTMIDTIEGRVKMRDLVGTNPHLYCTDGVGNVYVRQALAVFPKGVRNTVKVVFDTGDSIECTPNHEIMKIDGTFIAAKDLKFGDSVAALNLRLYKNYLYAGVAGCRKKVAVHNAVYEMKYGSYPTSLSNVRSGDSTLAHHIDNNPVNNHPDNILSMTIGDHSRHHSEILLENQKRIAAERKGKTWEEYYGTDKAEQVRSRYTEKRKGSTPWNKGFINGELPKAVEVNCNHKVLRVEDAVEQEVFDISMPDYHNFSANGVFVHNCWHPDIMEFITAKQTPGRLTKFNVSVNCTDEFMYRVNWINAIESGDVDWTKDNMSEVDHKSRLEYLDSWDLVFPDTTHPQYKAEWDGNILSWKAKGYPVIVHNTVSVRWLWNLIMESTYNRNEPGVLFLDRANYFAPLSYSEKILATNP